MSYDFRIHEAVDPKACECCGRPRNAAYVDLGNPTYNVGGIFRRASGGVFAQAKTMTLEDAREMFDRMLVALHAAQRDPVEWAEYKKLEPGNGWGSVESATEKVEEVLRVMKGIRERGGIDVLEFAALHDIDIDLDDESLRARLVPLADLRFTA